MDTGQVISGVGHVVLIGWVLFGNPFQGEPPPVEVQEVSIISPQAFEELLTRGPAPEVATKVALPAAPEPQEVPEPVPAPDPVVQTETPAPVPEPERETQPEVVEPVPTPEIDDTAPVLPEPPNPGADAPEITARPVPRESERVAPEPVAPAETEVTPDPIEREAVTADDGGETRAEEQEATAPEEATTEIVTEAEEPSGAPTTSLRPPSRRPAPPVRTAAPAPEAPAEDQTAAAPDPEPDTPPASDSSVDDAVREALTGGQSTVLQGPPLTRGERDALRVAVSSCWNVGSLSTEALNTTVIVAVDMQQDGRPIAGSIRLVSNSGGSQSAANQAFEAARRAIIRCGRDGFGLPVEKYGQWQEIEMTFNPEGMRLR